MSCFDDCGNKDRSSGRVVRRHGRAKSGRRDLAVAAERRAMERAGGSCQRGAVAKQSLCVLESGLVSAEERVADSVLQGGAQSQRVVGHVDEIGRWRANMVQAETLAGRNCRSM